MKRPVNPYPKKIFKEPTKDQYRMFHKLLKKEGLTLDQFSGAFGRNVWNYCCEEWKKSLPDEEEIFKIIKSNIKWSTYRTGDYIIIDSYEKTAKIISKRLGNKR